MASEHDTKVTLTFEGVTRAQAIALHAAANKMAYLAGIGSSRYVAFFADGDGNFRPLVNCDIDPDPYEGMTDDQRQTLRAKALVKHDGTTHYFDFDPVAWAMREQGGEDGR